MFDRKKALFLSKPAEMQTTAVEKVAPLTITSPKISSQLYNTTNVNLELHRKRETKKKK